MVDGHGYDGQLKYTICDACRSCHLILSILKPVCLPNLTDSLCLHLSQVPRSPDLAIFVSIMTTMMTMMTITLPLVYAHRVIMPPGSMDRVYMLSNVHINGHGDIHM